MKSKIYQVEIRSGEYLEEYYYTTIFCTLDLCKAERWVNKYNTIIKNNKKRLKNFKFTSYTNEPLWYQSIVYENPVASFKEVEMR